MGSLTLAPGTDARMWDHVTLRASDFEASARFYDTVLATLGVERTGTADWIIEWDLFSISPADDEKPPTRGLHIGFTAPSREHVDAFWQAGVEPATATTALPARGRSTGPTTTAASCWIRTATAPRRSTTISPPSAA